MKKRLSILTILILCSCAEQTSKEKTENLEKKSVELDRVDQNTILEDNLQVFLTYGELASTGYLDDENPITEKYGFKLKRVGGCEVEDSLVSRVLKQNKDALLYMNKKYREEWMKKFETKTSYKLAIPFF